MVLDADTKDPIRGAKVYLDKRIDRTNGGGLYNFNTPPGTFNVRVVHRNYHGIVKTITTPESGGFRQDFELRPITTGTIAGVVIDKETGKWVRKCSPASPTL